MQSSIIPDYGQQQLDLSPLLIENDYTLRTRTPPKKRSGRSLHQPKTNLDKAAAADSEEYLVIQSDGIPQSRMPSTLTSKSHQHAMKKKMQKKTTSASATETECRDPPPNDSVTLVPDKNAFETDQPAIERTYTNFINHSDHNFYPVEWKDYIESVADGVALQPESQAKKSTSTERRDPTPQNSVMLVPDKNAFEADFPEIERTYTSFIRQSNDQVHPVTLNGFNEAVTDEVASNLQPKSPPKNGEPRPQTTGNTVGEPASAIATDATESSIKNKNVLLRLISDAATRTKNRMETARERRRMLDEAKKERKEKKRFLKLAKKTMKSATADNYDARDKTAYVQLPSSPTAGLLELAEKLKQKGLPRTVAQKVEREEAPEEVAQVKKDDSVNEQEAASTNVDRVEVHVDEPASFGKSMFPAEFAPQLVLNSDSDDRDTDKQEPGGKSYPDATDKSDKSDGEAHLDTVNMSSGEIYQISGGEVHPDTTMKASGEVKDTENEEKRVESLLTNDEDDAALLLDEKEDATLQVTQRQVEQNLKEETVAADPKNCEDLCKSSFSSTKEESQASVTAQYSQESDVSEQKLLQPYFSTSELDSSAGELSEAGTEVIVDESARFYDHGVERLEGVTIIIGNDTTTVDASGDGNESIAGIVKDEHDRIGSKSAEVLVEKHAGLEHTEKDEEKKYFVDDEESLEESAMLEQGESFETFRTDKLDDDFSVLSEPDSPMVPGCSFYSNFLDKVGRWIFPLGGGRRGDGVRTYDTTLVPKDDINALESDAVGIALGSRSSSSVSKSIITSGPTSFDSESIESAFTHESSDQPWLC